MKNYEIYLKITRPIEIILSLLFLVILSPVMLVISILIKLENNSSSVIFSQKRLGKNNNVFAIYKFTTMKKDVPDMPSKQLDSKYRISLLGKILRKTHLNEIPQFVNVIKGEMRIIGPRPVIKEDVDVLGYRNSSDIKLLKPGITFLDRVKGGESLTLDQRESLEKKYIKYKSIFWYLYLDLLTLTLTLVVIIKTLIMTPIDIFFDSVFMKKNKKLIYLGFLVLVLFFVFFLSTKTGSVSNSPNVGFVNRLEGIFGPLSENAKWWITFIVRKTAHILEYAIIYTAIFLFIKNKNNYKKSLFVSFVIGIMFACFDEILQSFIPGRTSKVADVLIDCIGLTVGFLFFLKKTKNIED